MKVAIIGTTAYKNKMLEHSKELQGSGNEVKMPALDDHPALDEIGICTWNKNILEWADEVHIFWDQRSVGTIFDLGMCFAMNKRIKVIYLQPKTFANLMQKMEG